MLVSVDTQEVLKALDQMGTQGKSIAKLTPVIAEMLVSGVHDVYDAEGPDWKDLADSTKEQRRGSSYKILQDTGVMAGSTGQAHGADWAEAYGGAAYTIFHVTGTKYMDARNPFDLGPFMQDLLDDVAALVLDEAAK